MKRELKVQPIKDGTVIDHITAGQALNVLKILEIKPGTKEVVSVVMNVRSGKMGKKDIVKVENRELKPEEVDKIALIAPNATINIIRDYEVVEKHKVFLPTEIEGVIRCANPSCISNTNEPVRSKFQVVESGAGGEGEEVRSRLRFRCAYCERMMDLDDVMEQL
ncbi:aspartate carbamoyltransferase regulatory subunit [Candidatus Alkanophaga liquidiphilum]|nr:Aspartate carbamoyltransferase [Candidatus Alkanophaga liquidiphilum]RLG39077.1 MAG: aspartate carbamoyltransferase regulatory subunit [Candidatus Alkanophagales archaeon]